jgi:nucleotide-binding universal stress UspA family protein
MYQKIAVAFDGSDGARRALQAALRIARGGEKRLWMVFVHEMPRYPGAPSETNEEQEAAESLFRRLQSEAADAAGKFQVELVAEKRIGHAAQGLVQYVKDVGVDLLVIGHSGHSKLWGTFLGTTADKVVRHADCSVLVVR